MVHPASVLSTPLPCMPTPAGRLSSSRRHIHYQAILTEEIKIFQKRTSFFLGKGNGRQMQLFPHEP